MDTPTLQEYGALDHAYRRFNETLFGGLLPPALITLQRNGRSFGYFCAARFVSQSGARVAEIALNPEYFAVRSLLGTLSTLVHEMTHLQEHMERKPTKSYHSARFSELMEAVGLQTSATGAPYGERTGERMSHYVIEDGPFLEVYRQLEDEGFAIAWSDEFATSGTLIDTLIAPRWSALPKLPKEGRNEAMLSMAALRQGPALTAAPVPAPPSATVDATAPGDDGRSTSDVEPRSPGPVAVPLPGGGEVIVTAVAPSGPVVSLRPAAARRGERSLRSKFVCPDCRAAAWGKPSLALVCGRCSTPMPATGAAAR